MIKRLTFVLGLGLSCALVLAAAPQPATGAAPKKTAEVKAPPVTGTVMSIKGVKVEIEVSGEKPSWVKKGAPLKFPDLKGALGKVVEVTATGIVFNTKKAAELKVGGKVTLEKGTVVPSGC